MLDTVQQENAILMVLDRNLGHGLDSNGSRVAMPHGDVVGAQMRQQGFLGCVVLHTGDSAEQLKMYVFKRRCEQM